MTYILYILILISGFSVIRILSNFLKERKNRKKDLESWKRFKK